MEALFLIWCPMQGFFDMLRSICNLQEHPEIYTLQGDTISATHESGSQLSKGVGANSENKKIKLDG
ncbi:hypothetical protein CsSME_00048604 [Camellia sinensis var. sinensis]